MGAAGGHHPPHSLTAPNAASATPAQPSPVIHSAACGVLTSSATIKASSRAIDNARRGHPSTGCNATPAGRPSSTLATSSMPGMVPLLPASGVARLSPRPAAVAPSRMRRPLSSCAGMRPSSKAATERWGKWPVGPAKEISTGPGAPASTFCTVRVAEPGATRGREMAGDGTLAGLVPDAFEGTPDDAAKSCKTLATWGYAAAPANSKGW